MHGRNLVVLHRHANDRPGHSLRWDKHPRTTVTGGIEPGPIVKSVVTAAIDKEIEVHAGHIRDRRVRYDNNGWRRGQDNFRRRGYWNDTNVHVTGDGFRHRRTRDGNRHEHNHTQATFLHGPLLLPQSATEGPGAASILRQRSGADMPWWHAIVSARPNPSPNYRGRVVAASAAIAELGTEAHLQADIRTRCGGSWGDRATLLQDRPSRWLQG